MLVNLCTDLSVNGRQHAQVTNCHKTPSEGTVAFRQAVAFTRRSLTAACGTRGTAEEVGFEPTVPQGGTPVFETAPAVSQVVQYKDLGGSIDPLVPSLVPSAGNADLPAPGGWVDPDLARLARVWHALPEYIKRAILALVETTQDKSV